MRRLLPIGLALALGWPGPARPEPPRRVVALEASFSAPAPAQDDQAPFTLYVNGEKRGEVFVLLRGGEAYLERSRLDGLGFRPWGSELQLDGVTWVSLDSNILGFAYTIDDRTFRLEVRATPAQFRPQLLNLRNEEPPVLLRPELPAAFFNYAVDLQHDRRLDQQTLTAPHELGLRYGQFLLFSSASYTRSTAPSIPERYARLNTFLARDDPGRMVRYTLGDQSASSGPLGSGASVGGFGVARVFGTDPFFIRTSSFSLTGALETSAEVLVYRNGSLLAQRALAPGRFELQDLPLLDGSGDVTLVVKDALGRERRIELPYTYSQELLRKGVHDFGYTVGLLRHDVGLPGTSYGGAVAVLRHRVGLTDSLTAGLSGEFSSEVSSIGGNLTTTVPGVGTLGATAATSWGERPGLPGTSMGQAWRVGLTNGFPLVGLFYGASWGRYTSSYSNVALRPFGGRTLQDLNGSFGMGGNRWGSLSFYGGLRESSSTPGWRSTLGGRYSVPVWGWVSLSAAVARSQGAGPDDWSASLMLNKSFGRRASASLTVQQVGGVQSVQGSLQGSPEGEEGLGYRVSGQQQEQASLTADGEVSWAGAHGTVAVRAQALGGNEVYSARVAGSLTTLFDTVRFGRPVFDSFAVLQVDHLEGVPVYLGGRQVGTTDAQGEVLAPSVNSYGINPFLVKQQDLPFAYTAPRLGAMVLQPWRSGSRVTFDVQRVQAVHGTIAVAVGGAARPADYWVLTVTVNGKGEASPLVEGGEFYLENIPTGSHRVEVAKGDRRCAFTLVVPSSEEPVVELGALTCTTAPAAPAGSAPPPSAPAR